MPWIPRPRPGGTASRRGKSTQRIKKEETLSCNGPDQLAASDREGFTTGDRSGLDRPPTAENWLIKHYESSNLHHRMRSRSAFSRTTHKWAHHHPHMLGCCRRPWTGGSATSRNKTYQALVFMNKLCGCCNSIDVTELVDCILCHDVHRGHY